MSAVGGWEVAGPVRAAFNILNGKVIGSCLPRHIGKEFIRFLHRLEREVPAELDIYTSAVSGFARSKKPSGCILQLAEEIVPFKGRILS